MLQILAMGADAEQAMNLVWDGKSTPKPSHTAWQIVKLTQKCIANYGFP